MTTPNWVRDRRPVRRVVADEAAPVLSRDWPASIPAVAQVLHEGLELPAGVTLLVGENGSGKSTLVEAVAMAFGLAAEGGTRNVQEGTRATESPLHRWIRLERSPGAPRWGFFLRAETMHGYFTRLESFGTDGFHEMSHGESFLEILRTRFDSAGLYCLDEPGSRVVVQRPDRPGRDIARPRRRRRAGALRYAFPAAGRPARSPDP
jgi:predicted ATPase